MAKGREAFDQFETSDDRAIAITAIARVYEIHPPAEGQIDLVRGAWQLVFT